MVITNEQKEIRNLKQQVSNLERESTFKEVEYKTQKKICAYQETLINKLLNSIQSREVSGNEFKERY